MIIEKLNPVGVDVEIYKIQKAIHDAFNPKWVANQGDQGIICYPRCYINFKRRNKNNIYAERIIEYFDPSEVVDSPGYIDVNVDYKDILDGEENRLIIIDSYDFFPVERTQNFESTLVECIFIVNLNKAYPLIRHRADEEARIDVKKVLEKIPNVSIKRIVRSLNNVFGDLRYSTTLDMHPLHCFKVILSLDRFGSNGKIC